MRILLIGLFLLLAFSLVGIGQVSALSTALESELIDQGRLQWLSPTQSLGRSYDEMESFLIDANSDYFGLRVANFEEVEKLFVSYSINADQPSQSGLFMISPRFLSDFASGYKQDSLRGWLDAGFFQTGDERFGSWSNFFLPDLIGGWELAEPLTSINDPFAGTWLVRKVTPVPEPSMIVLLGSALLILRFSERRWNKAKNN